MLVVSPDRSGDEKDGRKVESTFPRSHMVMSEGGNSLTGGNSCQQFRFAEQTANPPVGPGVKDTTFKHMRSTPSS